MEKTSNSRVVMETRDHFKNGASPVKHVNRGDFQISLAKKSLHSALVILFISFILAACGNNSALMGKWEHESGPTRNKPTKLELSKNGIGKCDNISISWEVKKRQLIISATVFGTSFTEAYDYRVSGSKLTLSYDDGTSATFKKRE